MHPVSEAALVYARSVGHSTGTRSERPLDANDANDCSNCSIGGEDSAGLGRL
jgi:hypothetical protein